MHSTVKALVMLFACVLLVEAADIKLEWDAHPDTNVTGAIVYYGNASRNYPYHTNVGNVTRATVTGLTNGMTYFFAVTATNTSGLESDYSNEVSTTIPPEVTNRPPTLQPPPAVMLAVNDSTNIALHIWDVETPPWLLTVTASSTNETLLPRGGMTLDGTNDLRTLTLTPAAGQSGMTLVTVAVSDGAKASSTVFLLSVVPAPVTPRHLVFQSHLQVALAPVGPWSNILTTILPVDVANDGRFYRTWVEMGTAR